MTTFNTESEYIKAARKAKAKSRPSPRLFEPVVTLSARNGHGYKQAAPVLADQ